MIEIADAIVAWHRRFVDLLPPYWPTLEQLGADMRRLEAIAGVNKVALAIGILPIASFAMPRVPQLPNLSFQLKESP